MIISCHAYDVAGQLCLQTSAGYDTDEGPRAWIAVNQTVLGELDAASLPAVLRAIGTQLMRDAARIQAERRVYDHRMRS